MQKQFRLIGDMEESSQYRPQITKQTNKQMKGQSEIAYLPKFADLYVKLKL